MSGPGYQSDPRRVPVGVAVQMRRGNDILLIHRTGSHGDGMWSFPGGWLVPNETPEQAARREAWEEVGVKLGEVEFVGYTADAHPEGIHDLCLFFVCTEWEGEPRNTNPDRIAEVEWWDAHRLANAPRPLLFLPLRNALAERIVPQ